MTKPEQPKSSYSYAPTEQKKIIKQVMRYGCNQAKDTRWKIQVDADSVNLDIFPTRYYCMSIIMIRTIERLYNCCLGSVTTRKAGYIRDNYGMDYQTRDMLNEAYCSIHILFNRNRNNNNKDNTTTDRDEIDRIVSNHLNIFNSKSIKEMK